MASRARAASSPALLCGAAAMLLIARPRAWSKGLAVALVLAVGAAAARRRPRCSSWACATRPRRGSSRTTRPTRSSRAATCCWTLDNPYGHDYRESGLERFYTRDGSVSERVRDREVALEHFAYFPGAIYTAAVWRLLPEPLDDYRLLVLVCNLLMLAAALAFRGAAGRAARAGRRCSCATRSRSARPGSARTTRPACCCWWSPSRWSAAGASAGPPPPWRARSCSSSSRSWRRRSSR